ncbi:OmpA family protein [Salinimicrobium sp. TH3]|uniref:OmpA family protein n=1 Tax=Salinimicrobium sp. TH3 TaxID=2997342 RepID=UPI0022756E06|nr:OmpA family protein [Salinimicrobium sp. TH3]MCY2685572.1 OmpA family protein [Salinimicrobium sp. TH3]
MKKLIFLVMAGFLLNSFPAEAQFLQKLSKKAEQAAENAVVRKTEQKVTKKTDEAMDVILDNKEAPEPTSQPKQESPASTSNQSEKTASLPDKTWSKYNFVPGDDVIFEDDLSREENGEFPSRWDLVSGNAENASLGDVKIIRLDNSSIITPLIDKKDYLPEIFTVEFDAFFNDAYSYWQTYIVRFYPGNDTQRKVDENLVVFPLRINKNGASIITRANKEDKKFEKQGPQNPDGTAGWKHIAISYNQRALKVFIDEERILNIPNIELDPQTISIQIEDGQKDHILAIKNIKIAEGGKKLYDRIVADGKFITRGILFDVNKASLKPESMGVINEIAALMKEHADLKFSIEGHTDSDGDDSHNLKLSEQRAIAVKEALTGLGIDSSRMQTKGMGETVPVSDNASPEGKSNNRRVEFVKI